MTPDGTSTAGTGECYDQVVISVDVCVGCQRCFEICPTDVFAWNAESGKAEVAYASDCCVCLLCVTDCPVNCITVDLRIERYFTSIYDRLEIDVTIPLERLA